MAFYVLGALFALYIAAAGWQSKGGRSHARSDSRRLGSHRVTIDRRLRHWWRARERSKSVT